MRINFDIVVDFAIPVDFTIPIAPMIAWIALGVAALIIAITMLRKEKKAAESEAQASVWDDYRWSRPKEIFTALLVVLGGPISVVLIVRSLYFRAFPAPPTKEPRRPAPNYNY